MRDYFGDLQRSKIIEGKFVVFVDFFDRTVVHIRIVGKILQLFGHHLFFLIIDLILDHNREVTNHILHINGGEYHHKDREKSLFETHEGGIPKSDRGYRLHGPI